MKRDEVATWVAGLVAGVVGLVGMGVVIVGALEEPDGPPDAALAGSGPIVPGPPEVLTGGEAYIRTEVLSSDDIEVTHWIESTPLLFGVQLTVPRVVGADTGTEGVSAEQVVVVADGRTVTGPQRISSGEARYSFLGATSVKIRYRLTGAVERSGSSPGRALARVTALDVTYEPPSRTVTRSVIAAEVLTLACSSPARPSAPRPCGVHESYGEWSVDLLGSYAQDRVMAQLSLE